MDIQVLKDHYNKALNSLFAVLQHSKYATGMTIDERIVSIDQWIAHLQKLKRYLVFARHNTNKPKELE